MCSNGCNAFLAKLLQNGPQLTHVPVVKHKKSYWTSTANFSRSHQLCCTTTLFNKHPNRQMLGSLQSSHESSSSHWQHLMMHCCWHRKSEPGRNECPMLLKVSAIEHSTSLPRALQDRGVERLWDFTASGSTIMCCAYWTPQAQCAPYMPHIQQCRWRWWKWVNGSENKVMWNKDCTTIRCGIDNSWLLV